MVIRVSSIAAAAVLAVVGIMAFSSSVHARTPLAPAVKECPSGESISVTAPTVAAPTTVSVTVTPPVNLKPAKDADPASYHLHYFIDIDPASVVQAGQPVPTGNPKIIHSAATTQDLGALSAGKHTVWVVMGDVSHIVCNPVVQGTVSFDVAALPNTGTGAAAGDGVIDGSVLWLTVAAGVVIAAAGVALRRPAR